MICATKKSAVAFRSNVKLARSLWGVLSTVSLQRLKALTTKYGFSVAAGHLQLLDGRWYVTNAGLLQVAQRRRCAGIRTAVDRLLSDPKSDRWIFKATVYTSLSSRGFVGYGDADPSNVSPLVRGAVMRMAETRAVSRALRKAFGIGLCSVEELGWASDPVKPPDPPLNSNGFHRSNGSNGNPS